MTLEDFFTLTEMRDGLTTLLRVNELVTVMQKEKDSVVKNIVEAAREWSTVASTIAVTENRQCLDLFIQLDGLYFIDRWLKDVQNFSNDTGNNIVEESILALLSALEKLQIDNERSISSGIWMTVKNLIGHSSSKIHEKAKALFDGWVVSQESDRAPQVAQKVETLQDGGIDISHANGIEDKHVEPSEEEEKLSLDCTAPSQPERVEEEKITYPEKPIVDAIMENGPSNPVHSSNMMSNHVDEDLSVKDEISVQNSEGINDAEKTQETSFLEKVGAREISTVSVPLEEQRVLSSGADLATTLVSGLESDLRKDNDANDQGFCSKNSPSSDPRNASRKDNWMDDDKGSPNHYKSTLVLDTKDQVTSSGEVAEKSENSGDVDMDRSKNDSGNFNQMAGVKDCSDISKTTDMELDYGMVDPLDIARQVAMEVEREVDCREPSCSSSDKTSGGGLRQPDSPDSANRKQIEGPCKKLPTLPNPSPRPLPTETDPVINKETLGVDRENCICDMSSSQVTEAAQESEANMAKGFLDFDLNHDLNQEVCSEDMDRPMNQISTPIPVVSAQRAPAPFGVPNAPLQFVGALGWRGSAATSAFRRIPEGDRSHNNSRQRSEALDFDLNVAEENGEDKNEDLLLGKQIPNSSGFPSGEESSIEVASPRRLERVQLDLNHAGDAGVDPLLNRRRDGRLFQNQNGRQSPSQSSSSSSMQPSLKNFDLNMNDQQFPVQDSLSDDRLFGRSLRQIYASRTASNSSAISIMGARVELKPKDSVLPNTLPLPNGRIVEHHPMDLNLGRSGGFFGMGSSVPYNTNSPIYGFNSLASGSGVPFSSSMYGQQGGPIPYMVDSRGTPIVPQFIASASSLPPAFSQPTPFIMNMTSAGSSNGAGPSRQNFDLNSGSMIDGGNRETGLGLMINGGNDRETGLGMMINGGNDRETGLGMMINGGNNRETGLGMMINGGNNRETGLGLRQFLNPSQGRSLDDHLEGPQQQQSPSTGLGLKRQEPDSGWENYQFNYKHQPSWK